MTILEKMFADGSDFSVEKSLYRIYNGIVKHRTGREQNGEPERKAAL